MSKDSIKVTSYIQSAKARQTESGKWEIVESGKDTAFGKGTVWGMGETEEDAWQNAKENLDL